MARETKDDVEASIRLMQEFLEWSGLQLNPSKFSVLSMISSSTRRRYVGPFSPKYGKETISALKWEDTYKCLGIVVGRTQTGQIKKLRDDVLEIVDKILASYFTDWQKMDAINTFALSKLTYPLSTSLLRAAKLDADVRKKVKKKKSFRLPVRTISAIFHLPTSMGGFGLHSAEDNLESTMVMKAQKTRRGQNRRFSSF